MSEVQRVSAFGPASYEQGRGFPINLPCPSALIVSVTANGPRPLIPVGFNQRSIENYADPSHEAPLYGHGKAQVFVLIRGEGGIAELGPVDLRAVLFTVEFIPNPVVENTGTLSSPTEPRIEDRGTHGEHDYYLAWNDVVGAGGYLVYQEQPDALRWWWLVKQYNFGIPGLSRPVPDMRIGAVLPVTLTRWKITAFNGLVESTPSPVVVHVPHGGGGD